MVVAAGFGNFFLLTVLLSVPGIAIIFAMNVREDEDAVTRAVKEEA
jgi:hypothetical protein